jgi:hypothetical protein
LAIQVKPATGKAKDMEGGDSLLPGKIASEKKNWGVQFPASAFDVFEVG